MNASRILAGTAASLLVTASAGFGATYAWQTGSQHGPILGGLSVAMALGLELCKPLAVTGAFSAARSWRTLGQAASLAVLASIAIVFSLTAELSLMAALKSDAIADRAAENEAAIVVRSSRARIEAELATIAPARSSGEVRPAIETAMASRRDLNDCVGWLPDTRARAACIAVADLRAELGRAERRERLDGELAAINADAPHAEKAPDAGAKSLSTYLAALGVNIPAATISEWMTLVPVLALELGAAFSLLLVDAATRTPVDAHQTPCPKPEPQEAPQTPAVAGESTDAQGAQSGPSKLIVHGQPDERLVQLLTGQGGKVHCSQRSLGTALGISHGTVGNLLADMAARGRIAVTASKRGTVIELVGVAA